MSEHSVEGVELEIPDMPSASWTVEVVYEVDRNQIKLSGVWGKTPHGDEDYLSHLSKSQYDQCLIEAQDDYNGMCDHAAAMAEDGERH